MGLAKRMATTTTNVSGRKTVEVLGTFEALGSILIPQRSLYLSDTLVGHHSVSAGRLFRPEKMGNPFS